MTRPSPLRGAPGFLPVVLLTLQLFPGPIGCGGGAREAIRSCTTEADCGRGARCVEGACQGSTPPAADFTLPEGLTTHRAIALTASVRDPDPGDTVASWAWTVTRLTGDCDPEIDAAAGPTLEAAFWCPGTYQVELLVTDSTGAQGAPVRKTAVVTPSTSAPALQAWSTPAVEHRCAGAPLRCTLEQEVQATATGQAVGGGPLTFRWSAIPPDPSRAGAEVAFSPSAAEPSTRLSLSSGGGPLSGAWRLRVRADDADGNLAQAFLPVTVGNRPPAIDAAPRVLGHRYEAGAYRVEGLLAVPLSDPDGDPLEATAQVVEPDGSGCSAAFTAAALGAGSLTLSCPEVAGLVRPGRALRVSATDVNGGVASAEVTVLVDNRPPALQLAPWISSAGLELDHGVGPCPGGGSCFQVEGGSPYLAFDPDGDPTTVSLRPAVEEGRTASFGEAVAGAAPTFRFGTPVSLPAEFRSASGASGFSLSAVAFDPFGAPSPSAPALPIRIFNRPPAVVAPAPAVTVGHGYDRAGARYLAVAQLATFVDPDGDPLTDAGSTGDASCAAFSWTAGGAAVTCSRSFQVSATATPTLAGFAGTHALTVKATDRWVTIQSGTALTIANQPAQVAPYDGTLSSCVCTCSRWEPDLPGVCAFDPTWQPHPRTGVFTARPADLDGDPLAVTYVSTASVSPTAVTTVPPGSALVVTSNTFPVSVAVTADDGASRASATWRATGLRCSLTGQVCTTPGVFK